MTDTTVIEETPGGAPPPSGSPAEAPEAPPPASEVEEGGGATSETILEEAKDDAPVQTPADWPANWRDIMAGGNDKLLQYLNRYASPANVAKALASLRSKMDAGELQRSKPDGEDADALNEWRAQAGIPTDPGGYLDNMPDGLIVGEEDRPIVDSFLEVAHSADAPPSLVHQFIGWYYDHQEKIEAEQSQMDAEVWTKTEDDLRAEYGPEYRGNINAMKNLFAAHGVGDETLDNLLTARMADGSKTGASPDIVRSLVNIALAVNPQATITPTAGKSALETIQSRKAEIERKMTDTKGRDPDGYWNNPALQNEYKTLLEQEERLTGRDK